MATPAISGLATILLGVLITIAMGLASFSLVWMFQMNAEITGMSHKIDALIVGLDELEEDHEADYKQDSALSKHWALHSWAKHEIIVLRQLHNLPPKEWPNLQNIVAPHPPHN